MKDVRPMSNLEDYVTSTERRRLVATKDVPTLLSKEEFVENMGQEQGNANMKDVRTMSNLEEFVGSMVQR